MRSNEFALFLDEIREARNVSKEDFVKDIVSQRQYYRFIKGESTLKSDIILELLERLELDNAIFYNYFKRMTDDEFERLDVVYRYLYQDQLKEAKEELEKIDPELLSSDTNKKYYSFISNVLAHKQKKQTYDETAIAVLELVDYPHILSKNVLTYMEKNIMVFATSHLLKVRDYRIAEFFYKISSEEDKSVHLIDKNSISFRTMTAKCLGITGEHEKAYEVLSRGEKEFFLHENYLPMINLYFFKAAEEQRVFQDDRYKKTLLNVFLLLRISENDSYKQRYTEAIAKHFNIKESDLVEYK